MEEKLNDIIIKDGVAIIPEGTKHISSYFFEDYPNVEKIILPNSLVSIDERAFSPCKKLKSIVIPESVTTFGEELFYNCHSLESIEFNNSFEVLPKSTFLNCSSLKNVKFPKGLKSIESKAFLGCSSLKKITIPDTVSRIKPSAFASCENLEKVVLPNNPDLSINESVFANCEKLRDINLPYGMTYINSKLFYNCKSLENITIPETVFTIVEEAFSGSGIKNISLPNSVIRLYNSAFSNCANLEHIEIPDSVTSISPNCFENCNNLKSVKLPKDLKVIETNLFNNCYRLTEVNIPDGVEVIKDLAFNNCFNLESIEIPDSVTKLGSSMFFCCEKLKNVKLPNNITEIPHQLFTNCWSLTSVDIPESVTRISNYAFYFCGNLKNINIPKNVTSIGESAFQSCNNLENIEISDQVSVIEKNCFSDCTELKSVKLPAELAEISEGLFNNCSKLNNVVIPKNVSVINKNAFKNCSSLSNITIPEGVKIIHHGAFENCTSLESVTLPPTVTDIYYEAFIGCDKLKELNVPESITYFRKNQNSNLLFYRKNKEGFSLLSSQTPDSIPLEYLNIDLAFLTKNWKHKDLLLREQKNLAISQFYDCIIRDQPQEEIDKFLNSHNFTFFKQFKFNCSQDIVGDTNFGMYKLIYNLGGTLSPMEINGKTVDYAQKTCGFLLQKLQSSNISMETLASISEEMKVTGFKKEFTDFFLTNFDGLMTAENIYPGFIARCYNDFERVQKTNTSNRGSQRQLKPTIEKFLDYFDEYKFSGITDETKEIAETISPYFSDQETFEYAVEIDNERKQNNVPNSILSIHLRERDPFKNIDEMANRISTTRISILDKLLGTATNEFTYDWLEKNDPENFILGKLCSCCAQLEGVGHGIMRASIIHPNVQNLVIRNSYGNIVAKSTLFINDKEGYGVFNNVEIEESLIVKDRERNDIYEKFIQGVRDFAKQYNKEHPDKPLKKISVGMNANDLADEIIKNHPETNPLLSAIDYGKFTKNLYGYSGDSFEEQRTVWEME